VPDTSRNNRRQADVDVAATKQNDRAKQQPTSENVKLAEQKYPLQSIERESLTEGASVSKYGVQRVDNVEEKGNKNKQEDWSRTGLEEEDSSVVLVQHSDAADVVTGFQRRPTVDGQIENRDLKDNKPVQVQSQKKYYKEQKPDTELHEYLSFSKKEKDKLGKGIDYSETAHDSIVTDAANLDRVKPPYTQTEEEEQSNLEEKFKRLSLVGNLALVEDLDLKDNERVHAQSSEKYKELKSDTTEAHEYLSSNEKEKDKLEMSTSCSETEINSTVTVANNLAVRLRQEVETAAQTEADKQQQLKNECESHNVSLDTKIKAECKDIRLLFYFSKEAVETELHASKDNETAKSEQYRTEHGTPADVVDITTDHDATETVADVISGSDSLLSVDGGVENHDLKDNVPVHIQSSEKYEVQKSHTTEAQEYLSSSEEEKDELANRIGFSETALDRETTDAANLDRTEDNHKPPDAQTEAEEQSKLKNESESHKVSLYLETQTETEFPHNEVVKTELNASKDDEMLDIKTVEGELYRNEREASAGVGPATDHDATETVANVVSDSDHLVSVNDEFEDRDLKDNKPAYAQSSEKYKEEKSDTEAHEYLSSNEKEKDKLEKEIICSETEINCAIAVARLRRKTDTAAHTQSENEPKLRNECESHTVSLDIKIKAECPYKESVETEVHVGKDGEIGLPADNETVDLEQHRREHETPADVGQTTYHETETVADVVSGSEHLCSVDGQVEDHDHNDNKPVDARLHEVHNELKSDTTEAQKYLSSDEKDTDELEKRIGCTEMSLVSNITDSDGAEDSSKPLAANAQSNLEEKSKPFGLGVSEFSGNETVKTKVHVNKNNQLVRPSS